ncbi:hypothetical protein ACJDU8_01930 [Clostridium sp. WILCCON 0269]|uniref:Uncharacterized protein n=1 Tax=Candidatus Clostridium eludens TaxID=3381663 RepID=A0ABW8SEQ1_9CLOT
MANNIFVKTQAISETDSLVTYINYVPNDPVNGVPPNGLTNGFYVDSIPTPDTTKVNMDYQLHYNPSTQTFSYVYTSRPETQEQQIADLQNGLLQSQAAINMLLGV